MSAWVALAFAGLLWASAAAPLLAPAATPQASQVCRGAGHIKGKGALPTNGAGQTRASGDAAGFSLLDCPLFLALGLTPEPEFSLALPTALGTGPQPVPPMFPPATAPAWGPPARGPPSL